ncbi:MAG TPA: hypothetical protein VL651_10470 [Bacteroidia bacterium]|jgi:hypothetical protein|nr:hypothetical protein [Bacteroidia bacterium]
MKKLITTLLVLVAVVGFAQTSTTTTTSTTSTKQNVLINTWSLYQTETFNEVHAPTTAQKGDLLMLSQDGNYRWIYNGVVEFGKYQINSSMTEITLSASNGTMKTLKVLQSTATSLKVDYKDSDEIHNILYYKTGGTATTSTSTGK